MFSYPERCPLRMDEEDELPRLPDEELCPGTRMDDPLLPEEGRRV